MEETYQVTSALKHLPWGKHIALLTDARFSGVSTGACIGHIGPEALAGGPLGKLRDGDLIQIEIDRNTLTGRVDFVGPAPTDSTPTDSAPTDSAPTGPASTDSTSTGPASALNPAPAAAPPLRPTLTPKDAAALLAARTPHPDLAPDPDLPADTRLWAALQQASGGIWGGCVYDPDAILRALTPSPSPP
jgi:hypothetical protein